MTTENNTSSLQQGSVIAKNEAISGKQSKDCFVPRNDVKTLKPKLRFKEFDGDWEIIKIDKYCSFQQGVQVDVDKQKTEPFKDYIKFLRIENYTQESKDYRFIPNIYDQSRVINSSDIVVVRYGATAGFIGRGKKGVLANNLFKILPDYRFFCNEYLYHYLKSYKAFHFFQTEMSGGAMPALSFGIVKALKIPISVIQEQQKIASFLTSIDTKIQQLTTKKQLLENYKKGVMQQLFSKQLRFKPDVIANDSEAISNSKNAQISFPDWEEKKLGEIGNIVSGLTYSPKDIVDKENGVLVLRSSNVKKGKLSFKDNVFVKVDKFNPVIKDDILICVRNGSKRLIGKNAIIDNDSEGLAFGAFMSIYRSKFNTYLFHFFSSYHYKKEVHKNLGATINSINGSDLKKFKVPFPSLKEQLKIANYLSAIDTKIEKVQTQIEKTQAFKKGLLQQMFV